MTDLAPLRQAVELNAARFWSPIVFMASFVGLTIGWFGLSWLLIRSGQQRKLWGDGK